MKVTIRRFLSTATALALLGAAACSDDDGGSGPTGLAAPAGVTATQISSTSVRVSWNAVSGASGYLVQRAAEPNLTTFAQIGGVLSGTSLDDNVTEGVAYSYRVASVSASDTSDFSATVDFTTGPATAVVTGPITASRTLFADTTYTLSGYVKVASGATLTVQAGTKIVGDTTAGRELALDPARRQDRRPGHRGRADRLHLGARAPATASPATGAGSSSSATASSTAPGPILTEGGAAGQSENYAGGTDNNDNSGTLQLRPHRVRRLRHLQRRRPGAQLALELRRGPRDHVRVPADHGRPGRLVRVLGRRGRRPLPGVVRVGGRPLRLDRGLPGPRTSSSSRSRARS